MGEIRCFRCGIGVTPTDTACPACKAPLAANDGSTVLEPQASPPREPVAPMPRPDAGALPSWRRKVLLPLAGVALVAVVAIAAIGREDRDETLRRWSDEVARDMTDPKSSSWQQPDDGKAHRGMVLYVGDPSDLGRFEAVPLPPRFERTGTRRYSFLEFLRTTMQADDHYVVMIEGTVLVSFSAALHLASSERATVRAFEYGRSSLLMATWAECLILAIPLSVLAIDRMLIHRFRMAQQRAYEAYERDRTAVYYRARGHLATARQLIEAGELAKALVATEEALAILPEYSDALELKRLIRRVAAEQASVTAVEFAPLPIDRESVLYLRVVGTPFAYRAEPGATTIRVGRQRPRPDGKQADGNDLVIRIPASEDRTLRISRRHFEINRIGQEYFVIDHSGGQTVLNGRALERGEPAKLVSGDRLLIGDVMTLEVSVRSALSGAASRIVQLGRDAAHLDLEATVGDMMTEA